MYGRQKVGHLWIVEPDKHELEAFKLGADGNWVLLGAWSENDRVVLPPFAMEFDLSRWWLREE